MRRVKVGTQGIKVIMEGSRKAKVMKGKRLLEEVEFEDGDDLVSSVESLKSEYEGEELQESFSAANYGQWIPMDRQVMGSFDSGFTEDDDSFLVVKPPKYEVFAEMVAAQYGLIDTSTGSPYEKGHLGNYEIALIDHVNKGKVSMVVRFKFKELLKHSATLDGYYSQVSRSKLDQITSYAESKNYKGLVSIFGEGKKVPSGTMYGDLITQ